MTIEKTRPATLPTSGWITKLATTADCNLTQIEIEVLSLLLLRTERKQLTSARRAARYFGLSLRSCQRAWKTLSSLNLITDDKLNFAVPLSMVGIQTAIRENNGGLTWPCSYVYYPLRGNHSFAEANANRLYWRLKGLAGRNRNTFSWSQRGLATLMGWGLSSVKRAIKILRRWNLLRTEGIRNRTTRFTLLPYEDVARWTKPESLKAIKVIKRKVVSETLDRYPTLQELIERERLMAE